jgi:D-ribulokinase
VTVTNKIEGDVWFGLDIGTQGARALAVSDAGRVLGQGSQQIASWRDGCRHEQDPEEWWRAAACASRAALSSFPPSAIQGIAVDATSGTLLLVDGDCRAITSALMYDDARATEEAALVDRLAAGSSPGLAYRALPSWGLPKLLWLLRHHGGEISGGHLAHQADFINWRLAGHQVPSDSSNALKSSYDLDCETWPYQILDAVGVPQEIMPTVVRPSTQVGTVCAQAAAETGIPAGTPIFAGMTDGCAAQIAAGALEVGNWNSVLGTTLVLKGVSRNPIRDPDGIIYSHRLPDGNWLPGGASSTGAGVLTKYFARRNLDDLSARAAARGLSTVVAYPLVSRGERFPFAATGAEGFVLGTPSDEIDFFSALLEGVGFVERLCFDYFDLLGAPASGDIRFMGGTARNSYWCQLRADMLGRSVTLPDNTQPAFGMAVLAASPGQRVADVAKKMIRIREVIDPRRDCVSALRERYLRLVRELASRGWVQPALAKHAELRASQ